MKENTFNPNDLLIRVSFVYKFHNITYIFKWKKRESYLLEK